MATQSTPERRDVFEELFIELSELRGGEFVAEVATDLIRHERGGRTLVGLDEDGDRAIFHDGRARTLRAVPVEDTGLSRALGETLHRDLQAVEAWVRRHGDGLEWIHPRYRTTMSGFPTPHEVSEGTEV
jgi:hypothetical protein